MAQTQKMMAGRPKVLTSSAAEFLETQPDKTLSRN